MDLCKNHVSTMFILCAILGAAVWIYNKFNKLENDIAAINKLVSDLDVPLEIINYRVEELEKRLPYKLEEWDPCKD